MDPFDMLTPHMWREIMLRLPPRDAHTLSRTSRPLHDLFQSEAVQSALAKRSAAFSRRLVVACLEGTAPPDVCRTHACDTRCWVGYEGWYGHDYAKAPLVIGAHRTTADCCGAVVCRNATRACSACTAGAVCALRDAPCCFADDAHPGATERAHRLGMCRPCFVLSRRSRGVVRLTEGTRRATLSVGGRRAAFRRRSVSDPALHHHY